MKQINSNQMSKAITNNNQSKTKKGLIFCFLLFFLCCSIISKSQQITDSVLIRELDTLFYYDQLHRKQFTDVDFAKKFYNTCSKELINCLMELYNYQDNLNFIKLKELIEKYGYISRDKYTRTPMPYVLLHNIDSNKVGEIKDILLTEVKEGRMPGNDYARWYDRYLQEE